MKKFLSFLLCSIMLFSLSGCQHLSDNSTPIPTPIRHTTWTEYNFEIHSLTATGIHTDIIFCDDDVMIVDNSTIPDLQIVADYLKQKGVSKIRYALYATLSEEKRTLLPADRTFIAENTQDPTVEEVIFGTILPLGESTITFSEQENGIDVLANYRNSPYHVKIDKSWDANIYKGKPSVSILRASPDGVYNELRYENIESSVTYIGNVNTGKLHVTTCSFLPLEKNRVYFPSLDAVPEGKYTPCRKCSRKINNLEKNKKIFKKSLTNRRKTCILTTL